VPFQLEVKFSGCFALLKFLLAVRLPALESAGIARFVAAVGSLFPLLYILVFLFEEGWSYPDIDMLPG